jgi:hypothetical protein
MSFNDTRLLVIKNKLPEAFAQILVWQIEAQKADEIRLLWTQFNDWQDRHHKYADAATQAERNRILFAVLCFITETEQNGQIQESNKPKEHITILVDNEEALTKSYEALKKFETQTPIDLFIIWFRANYGTIFSQFVTDEKQGMKPNYQDVFNRLNWSKFMNDNIAYIDPNLSTSQLQHYFIQKSQQLPKFFLNWVEYEGARNRDKIIVSGQIQELLRKHKNLLRFTVGAAALFALAAFYNDILDNDDNDDNDDDD